jgi:hypothetical protein
MKRLLPLATVFFLVLSISQVNAWYNSTTYPYRSPIISNTTTEQTLSVNDTFGISQENFWSYFGGTDNYVYCQNPGCDSGLVAIGNDTNEKAWVNQTSRTGNSVSSVYPEAIAILNLDEWGNDTLDNFDATGFSGGTVVKGKFGNAWWINTTGEFNTNIINNLNPNNFTIELWLNWTAPTRFDFIRQSDDVVDTHLSFGWCPIVPCGMNELNYMIRDAGGTHTIEVPFTPITNVWYHVILTRNTTTMWIYINGTEQPTYGTPGATVWDVLGMTVGHNGGNGVPHFVVDELRFYNRTIYEPEAYAHFQNGINNHTRLGSEESTTALPTSITLQLNGSSSNQTLIYGQSSNITAKINITGLPVELYLNDVLINNASTVVTNITDISWFTNATYKVKAQYVGNDNYTASSSTFYINVLKQPTQLNLTINNAEGNKTYTFPTITNVTAWNNVTSSGILFYRNGTIVSSPEITTLPFGFYNYTVKLNNTNYSADSKTYFVTINQGDSSLSLTSSAGWSLTTGDTTTLTCTATSPLTVTLQVSGSTVSNPYTLQTQTGSYAILCTISDTFNYTPSSASNTLIANPLISCTGSNVFGFNKTITPINSIVNFTTLNFTDLVMLNYVRTNLGDVNISGVSNIYKNTTNGYFIVVNHTGVTSFVVKFGNSFVNNNYTNHAINETYTYNMSDYNQTNPVIIYNVLDELTGEELYPPNTTLMSIIHCTKGESYIPIDTNTTNFLLATADVIDKASLRITYTADVYYSRQLYPTESDLIILNFYVIDAFKNALDRIDFKMVDTNYYDTKLQIYKPYNTTYLIITEGYFDASHYFSAFLMEDSDYYLRVNNNGIYASFGRITVVKPDTKELGKTYYNLNPQAVLISDNILMNAYTNTNRTILYVEYNDGLNQTNSVIITILFENGTVFQNSTYTDSIVNVNYNITNYQDETFTVNFWVNHTSLGNSPIKNSITLFATLMWDFGATAMWYNLFALSILMVVGGLTTRESLIQGSIIFIITFLILWGIGWFIGMTVIPQLFVFTVFLLMLGIINRIREGGE